MTTEKNALIEVEGLDESTQAGWGDYPLDTVFVRTEQRTVNEVLARIRKGRYKLDPDFQRAFLWSLEKQSRLIESCLMRIPLPVFYVAESKSGEIIVVDGLQRLTTFLRFCDDEFKLQNLGEKKKSESLEGKKFTQLPLALRERLEDTQLIFYIIDSKAPERAKLDIFERVNSGVPLTRQQMRNCLYSGGATTFLLDASKSDQFLRATGKSLDAKSMRDREAINRFCAFKLLGTEQYSGDMDSFLGDALDNVNKMNAADLKQLKEAFATSMKMNHLVFKDHAFRKSLTKSHFQSQIPRTILNISLFDTLSVAFSKIPEVSASEREKIWKVCANLVEDSKFADAITYSTNSTKQVRTRFRMTEEALSGYFN